LPMPDKKVQYVGEPVAMVIAETLDQAKDAAELVEVDYEPMPAIVRAIDAVKPGAAFVWEDRRDNVAIEGEVGDKAKTDTAFAKPKPVVKFATWINRVTGTPMEPRAALGFIDEKGRYTIWAGTGGGMIRERQVLAGALGVPVEQCRAMCGDMGGNFGTRNQFFPEYAVLPWAAKRLGRPVKHMVERSDCFLTDYEGRDLTSSVELALDESGRFLGIRGTNLSNIGCYTTHFTPLRKGLGIMSSVYDIPAVPFRGCAVMTNTVPTTPYRSAGRPQAIYIMERLVDLAAQQCGFDPVELRRKNFIPPNAFPYRNGVGITYDNGEYERGLDVALRLDDYQGFAARKADSRKRGKLRGL